MKRTRYVLLVFTVFLTCCVFVLNSSGLAKDEFPTAPIYLLLGWAPGGAADTEARVLAEIADQLQNYQSYEV